MRMLWYAYKGDNEHFPEAKKEWEIGLSEHYMPDGVSPAGGVYCLQRWTSIARASKNMTLDVMEYMGYNEYYSNPSIVGLQEFLFGYANSPFGRGIFYGDSRHVSIGDGLMQDDYITSPTMVRTARFSPKAYKYAMWILGNSSNIHIETPKIKGYLISYLIMAGTAEKNNPLTFDPNDGEMAPSRIFDNYASLKSREPSTEALYVGMQNLMGNVEYHTHYEVNALSLAGYGEILLRNAGYAGPDRDVVVDGVVATFEYLHSMSESSNCVMIGGEQHTERIGDGVTEGFSGHDIEYFRGSTGRGKAIKGEHLRDVMFMQPADGALGYYVVMDHVETDEADKAVNVVWHPNAAKIHPVVENTQFLSQIWPLPNARGPQIYTDSRVELTTFLATEPQTIDFKTTVNQEQNRRVPSSYVADYMMANYATTDKRADILTVLFPGDKTHKVGQLTRLNIGDYSGARITQAQVNDIALTSSGKSKASVGEMEFQAEDLLFRTLQGKITSYFVRGHLFTAGAYGFESDAPIALHLKTSEQALSGVVTSGGATVTLYSPGVSRVLLGGAELTPLAVDSEQGWIQVRLPEGKFELKIE